MWPIVTYRVVWSVCHDRVPCKNGLTDQDAVWVVDFSGPKEPYIRPGIRYPMWRGNFEGISGGPFYKVSGLAAVSCAKTADPIEVSFAMWTQVGPRKHLLDRGAHWRHMWIWLNRPHVAVMQLFCQITLTTCFVCSLSYRSSIARAVLGVIILSVRLSVRLSVTCVLCD